VGIRGDGNEERILPEAENVDKGGDYFKRWGIVSLNTPRSFSSPLTYIISDPIN
jgi:hypothetical protein